MSDVIRVDLTPAEAQTVLRALDDATRRPLFGDYFHLLTARTKVRRAAENPLNGPTFDFQSKKAGEWCVNKDVTCGEPDSEGLAGFCGRECWERAGRPNPSPLHSIELGGEA